MSTLRAWTKPECYIGIYWEGWLVAPIARTRDSEVLTNANWQTQLSALEPLSTELAAEFADEDHEEGDATVTVVSENHLACGWIEWLAIHPSNAAAVAAAEELAQRYEDYPVLDEELWSRMEDEEAQTIWADCYSAEDRLHYIRSHRSQFEFRDYAELMAVCRGRYFNGYAGELIH